MKRARWFGRWVVAASCLAVLGLHVLVRAEQPSRPIRQLPATDEELKAKQRIDKQLDEILEVQAAILQRYDELMEELQVVKVRASQ